MAEGTSGVMDRPPSETPPLVDRRSGSGNKQDTPSQDAVSEADRIIQEAAAQRETNENTQDQTTQETQDQTPESEITRETQTKEAHLLADASFNIKGREAQEKYKKGETLSKSEQELLTVSVINGWATEDGVFKFEERDGLPQLEGKGRISEMIVVSGTGPEATVKVHIKETDEWTEVKRSEVERSQLITHKDDILDNFSGKQKEIIGLEIESIKQPDRDIFEGKTPDQVNQLIKDAAGEISLPTSEDFKMFVDKMEDSPQKQELLGLLGESNLPTAQVFSKVLENASTEGASQNLRKDIEKLTELLGKTPDKKEIQTIQRNIEIAKFTLELFKDAEAKIKSGLGAQEIFSRIIEGKIDPSRMNEIRSGLRTGNIDTIIPLISIDLLDNPNDTPEQKADKKLKREAAIKKAKLLGGLGLLAVLLMVMAGTELGKSATGQK